MSLLNPRGNNNKYLEYLEKYKCNFRSWNTSKWSLRSKCIFRFCIRHKNWFSAQFSIQGHSIILFKKCIIYFHFYFVNKGREIVVVARNVVVDGDGKIVCVGIDGVTRITERWALLLPAVSQSSTKATHENENESAVRLAMRLHFGQTRQKKKNWLRSTGFERFFIIEKKSICWHIFIAYVDEKDGWWHCFALKIICSTRRWVNSTWHNDLYRFQTFNKFH